jgi:hypothetical protein
MIHIYNYYYGMNSIPILLFKHFSYSLRPKKNDVLGFKICPKKNDILLNLACVHVHVDMQQSIST